VASDYGRPGTDGPSATPYTVPFILLAGGFLVILGSFSVWGACSAYPCTVGDTELLQFPSAYERSGVDLGWGIVTAVLGAVVVVAALSVQLGRRRHGLVEGLSAAGVLLAVGLHLYLSTYGPSAADDGLTGPAYSGVYLTVIGALVVLVRSLSRPSSGRSPSPQAQIQSTPSGSQSGR